MIGKWQDEINSYIPKVLNSEPDEKKAVLLAALYALQRHFSRQDETTLPEPENATQDISEGIEDDILQHINDELADSEMYYNLWVQTKEKMYKEFSQQELAHAEHWIAQARQNGGIPQAELQNYMTHHHALLAKLV